LLRGKGGVETTTTRTWAWKQPLFEESVTAHWSSFIERRKCTGLKQFTEATIICFEETFPKAYKVAERSVDWKG